MKYQVLKKPTDINYIDAIRKIRTLKMEAQKGVLSEL
jgi:hypothetical protein